MQLPMEPKILEFHAICRQDHPFRLKKQKADPPLAGRSAWRIYKISVGAIKLSLIQQVLGLQLTAEPHGKAQEHADQKQREQRLTGPGLTNALLMNPRDGARFTLRPIFVWRRQRVPVLQSGLLVIARDSHDAALQSSELFLHGLFLLEQCLELRLHFRDLFAGCFGRFFSKSSHDDGW